MSALASWPLLPWLVALPLGGAVLSFLLRERAQAVGLVAAALTTLTGLLLPVQVGVAGPLRHARQRGVRPWTRPDR
jgi:NADH:ubiquinone oxidoreductase subunit 4 (subunit M)